MSQNDIPPFPLAPGPTPGPVRPAEFVQAFERGLAVIRSFGEATPRKTLTEVARDCGITRAASRRFLITLAELGYVGTDGKYFWLLPRILELGYTYLASIPWWRNAQNVIDRLAGRIGLSCAAGVLEGDAMVYVAYAPGGSVRTPVRSLGTRLPAHATAMGQVLLANLDDAGLEAYFKTVKLLRFTPFTEIDPEALWRQLTAPGANKHCYVRQQLEIGLYSIGVPIRDRKGRAIAAVSASSREPLDDRLARITDDLSSAAREITEGVPS